jgi:hypothetical protein
MTLRDESLLTAYLDGELGPEDRSLVESAVMSDPELAEQLRQLAAVHELVAALPRPVFPADLAGTLCAALDRRAQVRGRRTVAVRLGPRLRFGFGFGFGLGLAATVLLALGLTLFSRLRVGPQIPAGPGPAHPLEIAQAEPALPGATPPIHPTPAGAPVATSETASNPTADRDEAQLLPSGERFAGTQQREADALRDMLDNPRLRRILFVTDILGGGADSRVEELVQKTPRTEATYARITVSQGIVIDPLHPNEATVFALVMNEQELRNFRKTLEQSFPQHVEEAGADPFLVTQLSDMGQVALRPGTRASAVDIPADVAHTVAIQVDVNEQRPMETTAVTKDFGRPDLAAVSELSGGKPGPGPGRPAPASPTPRPRPQALAESAPGPGKPSEPALAASSLPKSLERTPSLRDPPAIVLIWVTSRR